MTILPSKPIQAGRRRYSSKGASQSTRLRDRDRIISPKGITQPGYASLRPRACKIFACESYTGLRNKGKPVRWTAGRDIGVQAVALLAAGAAGAAVAVALGWSSISRTPAAARLPVAAAEATPVALETPGSASATPTPVPRVEAIVSRGGEPTVAAPASLPATPTTAGVLPTQPPGSLLPAPTPASPLPTPTTVLPLAVIGAPAAPVALTLTADEAWQELQPQLDQAWSTGPGQTIPLLQSFLERFPGYVPGQEKLYAALLASADGLLQQGESTAAVAELERAQQLLPDRPEAPAVTAALAGTTAADDEPEVVAAAPPSPLSFQAPPAPQPRPVLAPAPPASPPRAAPAPPPAAAPTPTKVPFVP